MIVKKIGSLLFIRLKLFRILAKIKPLLLIISLGLIFVSHLSKEKYQFQQPSLKTKLFDLDERFSDQIKFKPIFKSIKYSKLIGLLSHQCILITFKSKFQEKKQLQIVYNSLLHDGYLSKNVIFLSYQSEEQLQQFFTWYYQVKQTQDDFGIIRAGLNVQFLNKDETSGNQSKDRAIYQIYRWKNPASRCRLFSICEGTFRIASHFMGSLPKNSAKQSLSANSQAFSKDFIDFGSYNHFIDTNLCQMDTFFSQTTSAHQIMMKNSFQAATLKFQLSQESKKKASKLIYSFVKEFSVQQDHLHSSAPWFYHYEKHYFIPLKMLLLPGLLFLLASIIHPLNYAVSNIANGSLNIPLDLGIFIYGCTLEFYFQQDINLVFLYFLVKIFFMIKSKQNEQGKQMYLKIFLIVFQALVAMYYSVFCLSMAYLCMVLGIVMSGVSFSTSYFAKICKCSVFTLLLTMFILISHNGSMYSSVSAFVSLSTELKCILIPFLIFITL